MRGSKSEEQVLAPGLQRKSRKKPCFWVKKEKEEETLDLNSAGEY